MAAPSAHVDPLLFFTDGACTRNGFADARATFAVSGAANVCGFVEPFEYIMIGEDIVGDENGVNISVVPTETAIQPSNNRGELLAIIHALLSAMCAPGKGPCEIISDSRISIMTLEEWLPNRRRAGTAKKLRNLDLLTIAETLLTSLRTRRPIAFTHINSHQKAPAAGAPERDRIIWAGNAAADAAATALLRD